MSSKWRWFLGCFLAALAADQGTKFWARAALKPSLHPIRVIADNFYLSYSENPGAAFSLFRDAAGTRIFLTIVSLVALVVIAFMVRRAEPGRRLYAAGLGLVAGGAAGNLLDRAFVGRVTDFVVWRAFGHQWPTFNMADAALLIGAGLLLIAGNKAPHVLSPAKSR
jgi:signal peptidase II